MNGPQPIMPNITTPMVLRQILATPIYMIALIFNLCRSYSHGLPSGSTGHRRSITPEPAIFRTSND
jgi:hypothetical protein